MTTKRITISVPDEVARRIKRAAGGTPVSTWVTDRLEEYLDEETLRREWEAFYEDVRPGPDDRRCAKTMFRRLTETKRKNKDAA